MSRTPHEYLIEQIKVKNYSVSEEAIMTMTMAMSKPTTVQAYLQDKGLSNETLDAAKALRIENGVFATWDICESWCRPVYSLLKAKVARYGAPLSQVNHKTGVLTKFKVSREVIVVPVFDLNDNYIGMTIRIIGNNIPQEHDSAWIEPGVKRYSLYNLKEAMPYIQKVDKVFVVESNMDCLAMKQAGLLNTVSLMGVSLSEKHMFLLTSLTKNVILCLDVDGRKKDGSLGAGEKSALSTIQKFKNHANFFVVKLPPKKDPDVFLKENGTEALIKRIERVK